MNEMDFGRADLVAHFGSWVRVQVAFYDFLFETATQMGAKQWKEGALEAMLSGMKDGEAIYEEAIGQMEKTFPKPCDAWPAFLAAHVPEHAR